MKMFPHKCMYCQREDSLEYVAPCKYVVVCPDLGKIPLIVVLGMFTFNRLQAVQVSFSTICICSSLSSGDIGKLQMVFLKNEKNVCPTTVSEKEP